jgi:hypothetical protein
MVPTFAPARASSVRYAEMESAAAGSGSRASRAHQAVNSAQSLR